MDCGTRAAPASPRRGDGSYAEGPHSRLRSTSTVVTNDGSIDSMEEIITNKPIKAWLTDMDGVLVHEDQAIPALQTS